MKLKKIPKEYFVTILDRLTRFEPAYKRYNRVFDDIINKFASEVKLKELSVNDKIAIVEEIVNSSTEPNSDFSINSIITGLEEKSFILNQSSYQYLSTRINISSMLNEIRNFENLPKNIKWLLEINNNANLDGLRENKSLLYPIEKILLCEGETERILLPALMKLMGVDFDKTGILLISSGGKNQVVRKFYSMLEYTKLPIVILLDKDAKSLKTAIENKLRPIDMFYIINSGEFEDIIPKKVLVDVINYVHKNDLHCLINDFKEDCSTVENIENIYKKYGFGEFKKAQFAKHVEEYVLKYSQVTDFTDSEILTIAKIF